MTYYRHLTNESGGNPYISFNNKNFFGLVKKYVLEMVNERQFIVLEENKNSMTYQAIKEALRNFAIEYSLKLSDCTFAYSDLLAYNDFFETYGKRYGLLTEFRENAIC